MPKSLSKPNIPQACTKCQPSNTVAKPYFQWETEQTTETSHQVKERTLHLDSIVNRPASDIWWNMMQCHIDNDTKSRGTAKIYDPVYSSDVVFAHICANKHINNEAEADTRIREAGISGKVTPVFLGAWVMEVPVPSKDFGGAGYATTSGYVEPQPQIPQAWRREVLAKIYEAVAFLGHAGIRVDVGPDGIFVRTFGLEDGRLDVRVFVADISKARKHTAEIPERPVSPIENFWDDVMYDVKWLA
ncbi:hypothetical protein F5883DRAFT_522231 [Diaporthe sp. PMI_573]|nr:hypothetical protein F5883DRAFT_522231 [Diaporthaceae sp. PMI_573]